MSDFPSINDLIAKKPVPPGGNAPSSHINVVSGDVQKAFEKKMKAVAVKEKETETQRFAAGSSIPYIDLEKFPVSQEALRQVSQEEATRLAAVCFFANQEEVRVAAIDPEAEGVKELTQNMKKNTGAHVLLYVISKKSFDRVMDLYKTLPNVKPITKDIEVKAEDLERLQSSVTDFSSFQELIEKTSTTDLVTFVMAAGLKLGASDVHIEAEETGIVVRFRLDGILHDAAVIAKERYKQLVSRLKLTAGLKLNITDKPQDGRFSINTPDGTIDVRVSTIPTIYGESTVMRLLVQREEPLSLEQLGLRGNALELLKAEIARPNGMIITTGPTGSGKTTTLYSIMHILNKSDVKIITMEDPVEYKMEGINQSQIDRSKDYTFAKGLKSMLRQDPDIAMVGEIRELETAEIAIQAALTGHLILSTIHTNDAFGAIPRFLSMGVKPFLLAPALNCVIGQRLVRKLDPEKKVTATLTPEQEKRVNDIIASMPEQVRADVETKPRVFYTAPETEEKGGIGYKGRIGIYEIFQINKEVEEQILSGQVSEYAIRDSAIQQGTVTMVQDGILKALDGLTSVDEVFRVAE